MLVETVADNEPSLTVKLRLSVPNQLADDVRVATSPFMAANTCWLLTALMVRFSLSTSLTKLAMFTTKLPSSAKVYEAGRVMVGASLTGVTVTMKLWVVRLWSLSLLREFGSSCFELWMLFEPVASTALMVIWHVPDTFGLVLIVRTEPLNAALTT